MTLTSSGGRRAMRPDTFCQTSGSPRHRANQTGTGAFAPASLMMPRSDEVPVDQRLQWRRSRAVELHQHSRDGAREVDLVGRNLAVLGLDPAPGVVPIAIGTVLGRPFGRDRIVLIVIHHGDHGNDAVREEKPDIDQAVGSARAHHPEYRSPAPGPCACPSRAAVRRSTDYSAWWRASVSSFRMPQRRRYFSPIRRSCGVMSFRLQPCGMVTVSVRDLPRPPSGPRMELDREPRAGDHPFRRLGRDRTEGPTPPISRPIRCSAISQIVRSAPDMDFSVMRSPRSPRSIRRNSFTVTPSIPSSGSVGKSKGFSRTCSGRIRAAGCASP